ncbi:thiol:disulfide interchange protein DsbA/DsbL [Thiogranum longum]
MKRWLKLIALLLFAPLVYADFNEGTEYQAITNAQPTASADKIEVLELFWYGCPHCYHFEPVLEDWLKNKPDDVVFVRMPAILGPNWELLARGYYTAEFLDAVDKIHKPLFDYIHKERKRISSVDELKTFFVEHGVSASDFDNTFNSFAVITKTNRSKQVRSMYGLTGVPTLVINGKYRTTAKQAGGNEKMLKVVDYLIDKERVAAAGAEAAAE